MRTGRSRPAVALAAAVGLLLGGCADDGASGPDPGDEAPGVDAGAGATEGPQPAGGDGGPGDDVLTDADAEDTVPPWAGGPPPGASDAPPDWSGEPGGLQLASGPLTEGSVPPPFTCDGPHERGKHPPMQWQGVPDGTAVLAVVLDDPDAPGGRFLHWNVSNIDPALGQLESLEDDAPDAVEGASDDGQGYLGPCPPPGEPHTYELTLYALPEAMDPPSGGAEEVRAAYEEVALAAATLTFVHVR